jgi:hypothetical protein
MSVSAAIYTIFTVIENNENMAFRVVLQFHNYLSTTSYIVDSNGKFQN